MHTPEKRLKIKNLLLGTFCSAVSPVKYEKESTQSHEL